MDNQQTKQLTQNVNFVECVDVDEANRVPMDIYRFERFSEGKCAYIFVKRVR